MDSLKVLLVCALLLVAVLSIEAARVYPTQDQGVSTQINHNYGDITQNKRLISTSSKQLRKPGKKPQRSPNYHKKREAAAGFNYGAPNLDKTLGEPLFSFVKTDYNGHVKWGVRHRVGSQSKGVQGASEAEATEPRVRRDHHEGVTGPVHTFVKTDKHAHFKWGVRHHVGNHYG